MAALSGQIERVSSVLSKAKDDPNFLLALPDRDDLEPPSGEEPTDDLSL